MPFPRRMWVKRYDVQMPERYQTLARNHPHVLYALQRRSGSPSTMRVTVPMPDNEDGVHGSIICCRISMPRAGWPRVGDLVPCGKQAGTQAGTQ